MTENTMVKEVGKRMTRKEKLAEQNARHQEALEKFEKERNERWLSLLVSAQRILLALHTLPELSEGIILDYQMFGGLQVDIEANSITHAGVGTVTRDSLTYEQAESLRSELDTLETIRKDFIERQRTNARIEDLLTTLREQAIAKLTDADRVALGVYAVAGRHRKLDRRLDELESEERSILEKELALQSAREQFR